MATLSRALAHLGHPIRAFLRMSIYAEIPIRNTYVTTEPRGTVAVEQEEEEDRDRRFNSRRFARRTKDRRALD